MRALLLILGVAACRSGATGVHATDSQWAVVRALSGHDGVDCARVAAASPEPAADLVWVAENWRSPGWVGVRAAECLQVVADAGTYEAAASRWAADPGTLGLAETVSDGLDALDPATAGRLARALAAGPHAALLERTP